MSGSGFDWDGYRAERQKIHKLGDELEANIREHARQIIAIRAELVRHERVAHQVKAMIRAAGAKPWGEK